MTNSANEPLPVGHETAINDDTAEGDSIEPSPSVQTNRARARGGETSEGDSETSEDESTTSEDDPG